MKDGFFKGKNILIISPEGWEHLFVSKHHYAIELAKNNKVFFLNPPSGKFSMEKSNHENLWVINYTSFIRGLRFLPVFLMHFALSRKFARIQELAKVQLDCVWSFDNSVFFDFSIFPKRILKISHIVDFSQNFQFEKAATTADLCFGVSQNIVKRLIQFNKDSFLIPHGISIDNAQDIDIRLPGRNLIKAMYAGNLDSQYIDKPLLFSLIENYPKVDFIFLGSGGAGWLRLSNTFFLGRIKHEQLLSYLKKADVLLLVYDVDKYPDQLRNAHKILEYLASGKVVVSTSIHDYEERSFLLEMAAKKNDFPNLFDKVISHLSFYNNEEDSLKRMEFAWSNSYANRLREIETILNKFLNDRDTAPTA